MMDCDTEWREVGKKRDGAEVSDCALCIIANCFLRILLRHFFSTLVGVQSSATIGGTTKYVLMGFMVLVLTISSNTGAFSEYDE